MFTAKIISDWTDFGSIFGEQNAVTLSPGSVFVAFIEWATKIA